MKYSSKIAYFAIVGTFLSTFFLTSRTIDIIFSNLVAIYLIPTFIS